MTRTARRGALNKKRHEGTDWSTLQEQAGPLLQPDKQKSEGGSDKKQKGKSQKSQGEKFKMLKKGRTAEEEVLRVYMHKEERREKRRQKRAQERLVKKVCFKCRMPGHKVEDCLMNSSTEGTGICYRCGSAEHTSSACKSKAAPGHMPFASCFVCGKQGHISKKCPDNPRGLYPKGGGCRTCGSVEHFQRDCPEYLEKQGISSKRLKKVNLTSSADAEDELDNVPVTSQTEQKLVMKKLKVVKF